MKIHGKELLQCFFARVVLCSTIKLVIFFYPFWVFLRFENSASDFLGGLILVQRILLGFAGGPRDFFGY